MQGSVGINSQMLHKLSIELQTYYYLRMRSILNQAVNVSNKIVNHYVSNSATQFKTQFNDFAKRFDILNSNILNYSKTLDIVERSYNKNIQSFSSKLKKSWR